MADRPPVRLVSVETLRNPLTYAPEQIRKAYDVAYALNRGKFILAIRPAREQP